MSLVSRFYPKLMRVPKGIEQEAKGVAPLPMSQPVAAASPVVIAGFGRVGQNIAQGLQDASIPYSVIELDPKIIFNLRCAGTACIYGDASNTHVLSRVDLKQAQVLVVKTICYGNSTLELMWKTTKSIEVPMKTI